MTGSDLLRFRHHKIHHRPRILPRIFPYFQLLVSARPARQHRAAMVKIVQTVQPPRHRFHPIQKLADQLNWAGENPSRKEAVEVIKLARPTIFVPGFYEINGPLDDAFNAIVEGQKQPQEAMDEVHRRLTIHLCRPCYRGWIESHFPDPITF